MLKCQIRRKFVMKNKNKLRYYTCVFPKKELQKLFIFFASSIQTFTNQQLITWKIIN